MQKQNKWIEIAVMEALGSTPRNAGTLMWVSENHLLDSIGGGRLEFLAIKKARDMLIEGSISDTLSVPLGPAVKQCCGGFIKLQFNAVQTPKNQKHDTQTIYVYGQGHVGKALTRALNPLPFNLIRVDSRESFLSDSKDPIECAKVAEPSSWHIVMTHDHGLDLEICAALLERKCFSYIGLIGSKSKRAKFFRQLSLQGYDPTSIQCPVGVLGIIGKEPAIIAASIVAELLILRSANNFKKLKNRVA